ncbi:hypothetical protein ACQP0C_27775 [Nocardia sp. CA-129566]|uniref:hypothetical protein n=1 Tax=Nocardia sp. CA-129566 TaxID=3239976 RepID=UPI003D96633D
MTLRQYLVTVHCCDIRWVVHVPAVARWTLVERKKAIETTTRAMIAAVTGTEPTSFGLDLTHGRVVNSIEEFAIATGQATQWDLAVTTGPPDAA